MAWRCSAWPAGPNIAVGDGRARTKCAACRSPFATIPALTAPSTRTTAATLEASDMSDFHPGYLLNAIVYSVLGILIFSISFVIIDKMTPYDLWREICEN